MGLWLLATEQITLAESAGNAPDFKEVYDLIRTQVPGMTDSELNRAVVQGLVSTLSPKVSLITNGASADATGTMLVSKVTLFDDSIAYLRIARVENGLAKAIGAAYQQLSSTNKLKGLVLDLRYADGTDYSAAAAAADLFVAKAQPLLNWGNGSISSTEKTNAIPFPLAVLVNRGTSGSAEALAAVLREAGAALILGTRTAGQALVAKEFPLRNGERLRIATAPVTLGDGSTMSAQGIKPDIDVTISLEDERAYYADAFWMVTKTNSLTSISTNSALRRSRLNEAELVREHREGLDRDTNAPTLRETEPDKPIISDPALARALDLLKGLAVMRQSHS
jgi:C-terminal processing protease CtpA/Prc